MFKAYLNFRSQKILNNLVFTLLNPISFLIIFFLLGIVAQNTPTLFLIAVIIFIIIPGNLYKCLAIIAFSVGFIFISDFRNNIEKDIKSVDGMTNIVTATIVEPPSFNLYDVQAVLKVDGITSLVLAELPVGSKVNYADRIKIKAKFNEIDEKDKGYENYLHSKSIFLEANINEFENLNKFNIFKSFASFRDRITDNVNNYLLEPEASIFNGILLGKKDNLNKDLKENLKITGTSHIVSASGFNVITIYILLSALSGFLNQRKVYLISIIALAIYTLMVGVYNLPALRAGIMLTYVLLGNYYGRKQNVTTALLISVFIITLISPLNLTNISMALSTFATLGLFLLSPIFNTFFKRIRFENFATEVISSSIAASIFTLPIIWLSFKEISLIAIPINIIVLPLIPIIMYLGLAAVGISIANIYIVNQVIFYPIHLLLNLIVTFINEFARIKIQSSNFLFIAYFGSMILAIFVLDYVNYYYDTKSKS